MVRGAQVQCKSKETYNKRLNIKIKRMEQEIELHKNLQENKVNKQAK